MEHLQGAMKEITAAGDVEALAKELVGNWEKFESFSWSESPKDAELWCIVNTSHRDSTLMDQSNEAVIQKALAPFEGKTVLSQTFSHWAVGYMEGVAIKVYSRKGGPITKAFKTYADLHFQMEDYPVLDDDDYMQRQYDASIQNIEGIIEYMDVELTDKLSADMAADVYSWLAENNEDAIEDVNDEGAYPNEDTVKTALEALGLILETDESGEPVEKPRGYEDTETLELPLKEQGPKKGADMSKLTSAIKMLGDKDELECGFAIHTSEQGVMEDNFQERRDREPTEEEWSKIGEDIDVAERNMVAYLRGIFDGIRVDGHDSDEYLVGSIWCKWSNRKGLELIKSNAEDEGHQELSNEEETAFYKDVSQLGLDAFDADFYFFGINEEDLERLNTELSKEADYAQQDVGAVD
jgi:hypothetical protein